MVVQEVAVQQPTREQEELVASGKRQRRDKRQRTREARQEVVARQDVDATTNQRTKGEHREAGATRGKSAGGLEVAAQQEAAMR